MSGQVKPGGVPTGVMLAKMTIVVDQHGNINVDGPMSNKMLCYGMIERAKDIIRDYEPPRVEPVPANQLPPTPKS